MTTPAFTRSDADTRRRALIEATAQVLARDGAAGASVRTVAKQAGVSPGLVTHHFGSMDALVAATYTHVGETVADALADAVKAAGADPRARLLAYVTASFTPPIADPDLLGTWIAFWSLTRSNAAIAKVHAAQYAGFRGELEALLVAAGLLPFAACRGAIYLTALVDGLWLESCLSPDVFAGAEAAEIAREAMEAILPPHLAQDR